MTEKSAKTAAPPAGAHCDACGCSVGDDAAFCGECGHRLSADGRPTETLPPTEDAAAHGGNGTPVEPPSAEAFSMASGVGPGPSSQTTAGSQPGATPAWGAPSQASWAQPTGSWPTQPGYGAPPPPPPGYPAAYAGGYPAPPPRKTNTGLMVGLAAAAVAAVGLIVAVVLLATGSHNQSPTITSIGTQASATIKPVSPSPSAAAQTGGPGNALKNTGSTPSASPPASGVTTSSSSTPPANDVNGARGVVQEHWARIGSGDYSGAYALLGPGVGGTDESSWVASHQQEHPQVLSAVFGTPTFSSPSSATVPIVSLKTSASDGCKTWTGSYGVTNQNGQWIISSANLSEGPSC